MTRQAVGLRVNACHNVVRGCDDSSPPSRRWTRRRKSSESLSAEFLVQSGWCRKGERQRCTRVRRRLWWSSKICSKSTPPAFKHRKDDTHSAFDDDDDAQNVFARPQAVSACTPPAEPLPKRYNISSLHRCCSPLLFLAPLVFLSFMAASAGHGTAGNEHSVVLCAARRDN